MKQTTKANKTFDAVAEMRAIREKLSERYWHKPEVLKSDMEVIKKKMKDALISSEG